VLAAELTANSAWVPDIPGQCCILASLLCLAHAPRAWSGRADTGVWSLTLLLLAAVTGLYRLTSLAVYVQDPHLMHVSLAELIILAVAAGLVAPDAARAPTATPSPPLYPQVG
jgi:hypothetical protein